MTAPETSLRPGGAAPAGGDTPRAWRIEFPAGVELLTSNDRTNHWGKRNRVGGAIRDAAIVLARKQKIPALSRVTFLAEFCAPPGRRRVVREAHNLGPSVKAAIDGITRAGVIPDDSDRHVHQVIFQAGPPHPLGQLVITVIELPTPAT